MDFLLSAVIFAMTNFHKRKVFLRHPVHPHANINYVQIHMYSNTSLLPAEYIYIYPHASTNTSTLEYIHIHKAYILNILRTKQEKIIRFDPEWQIFAAHVSFVFGIFFCRRLFELLRYVSKFLCELIYSCADSKPRGRAWLIVLIKPETSISSEFDIRRWSKAERGQFHEDDIIMLRFHRFALDVK